MKKNYTLFLILYMCLNVYSFKIDKNTCGIDCRTVRCADPDYPVKCPSGRYTSSCCCISCISRIGEPCYDLMTTNNTLASICDNGYKCINGICVNS